MSATTLTALIAHWRALCRPRPQVADGELLRRFTRQRDAAAFEQLLERYAALVWGVCRRILPSEADCEDTFQAVFLALVRRPDLVDPSQALGAWLHTVAVRVARKAQIRSRRQHPRASLPEQATPGDVADEVSSRELFRMVDEEIERLPSAWRLPVILCCLEGRTRDEAAETLGCSVAAIKGRLERGRALLRQRLGQRGIQLPAAFLVLSLTSAPARASLRMKAIQTVLGSAPPSVAVLVPAMGVSLASKLTLTAMSLVMVGVVGFGAYRVMEAEPPKEATGQKKDAAAKSPQPPAEKARPRLDRFGDPLPPGAIRRFGTRRFRHAGNLDLAFTPDGKQLIAGTGGSPLSVFDALSGRVLRRVGKNSFTNPEGFALSPDGKSVACCGSDVFLWDLETGRLIRKLGCDRCQAVAFSPDGKVIAVVRTWRAEVIIVEAATGKHLAEWTVKKGWVNNWNFGQYDFRSLAFSPDGKFLAGILSEMREEKLEVITVSSQICMLDAEKGTQVRAFSTDDTIPAFAFQPGSGRLASFGKGGILRFWDAATGKEVQRFPTAKANPSPIKLRFSADGRRCLVQHGGTEFLTVLDAKNGRELRRIEIGESKWPDTIALSADGRTVASAKLCGDSRVRVWDVESGVERLADAGHSGPAMLSLSADGRTLISRGEKGETFHWDVRTAIGQRKPNAVGKEAALPWKILWNTPVRGPRWQYGINSKTMELEVRSLDGSRLLRKAKIPTSPCSSALSPDGKHLAVAFQDARRNTIFLWDPEKEETPRFLSGHPQICQHLLFSHNGKRLIATTGGNAANASESLWIWDVATARLVRKLAANCFPISLLLTADDRVLFSGTLFNDAAVYVWDMETGKELARLADRSPKNASADRLDLGITGLTLSADERFLAVVSSRGDTSAVSIWETGSWKLVKAFAPTQPRNGVSSMVFSRAGRSLFVANSDSTILQWDVSGQFGKNTKTPNRDLLNHLWRTLDETPDKAYPAVWEMLDHPAESVPFLIGKLSPVQPVEEKRVRQLLKQLDSESFAEREEANRRLLALGELALPLLRQALKDKPSLEMKKRLKGAIESLTSAPSAEHLRLLRALAVLEWSGSTEADAHLRRLSKGNPSAMLTRAAKAARQRR